VTDIMGEIASASQEQSAGIEQVNHAIAQMDRVTQQNAALVEEAAAAAQSMEDQAKTLAQVVGVFRLAGVLHPTRAAQAIDSPQNTMHVAQTKKSHRLALKKNVQLTAITP
jgi:methyl-accepting chemotaxis protein